MKIRNLLIGALCTFSLTACTQKQEAQTFSNMSLDVGFDSFLQYQETSFNKEEFDTHFNQSTALFKYYNNLFDIYNDYEGLTNLKTINDNAGIKPVKVDTAIIDMLKQAKYFYDISNGEFDITMGNLLKVWHTYRTEGIAQNSEGKPGRIPEQSVLEEAAKFRGWDSIEINETENTVFINNPNVSLDVGGIAKGFAAELVAKKLSKENIVHAVINAGGNNRTLGPKYDRSDWRVRIQNPAGNENLLIVSRPGAQSFVTSGDYQRFYYTEDGQIYHHIIDPATNFPAKNFRSVSIITEDSGAADCLSTTLFTLSYEDGLKVLEAYRKDHPNTTCEAIWILDKSQSIDAVNLKETSQFKIVWTDGLNQSLIWE